MIVPDPEAPGGERVKLLDFGIAKLVSEQDSDAVSLKTRTGQLLGTPVYMSPEQCRGTSAVGAATDVYSLGVLMFEMLTGLPPFRSVGVGELMMLHMVADPPPLGAAVPGIDVPLEDLIRTMLAKDPSQRPTMIEVNRRLQSISRTGVSERLRPSRFDEEDESDSLDSTRTASELGPSAQVDNNDVEQVLPDTPIVRPEAMPSPASTTKSTLLIVAVAVVAVGFVVGRSYISAHSSPKVRPSHPLASSPLVPSLNVTASPDAAARPLPASPPVASADVRAAPEVPSRTGMPVTSSTPNGSAESSAADPANPDQSAESIERAAKVALAQGNAKLAVRLLRPLENLKPRRQSVQALLCRAYGSVGPSNKAASACRAAGIEVASPVNRAEAPTAAAGTAAAAPVVIPDAPPRRRETQIDYLR